MSVYERNGSWYINVQVNGDRIHRRIADNKEEALKIQESIRRQSRRSRKGQRFAVTFKRAADEFLNHVKDTLSPRTHTLYSDDYRNHLEPFFRDKFLHDIDNSLLLQFQAHQKRKKHRTAKLGNRTVNIHMGLVSKIMNFAAGKYLVPSGLKYPMLREPKRLHAFFGFQEWDDMIELIKNPLTQKRIRLGRLTGMRPKELAFLSWEDIDLEMMRLYVRSKPKAGFTIKTDEERSIPLSEEAAEILRSIARMGPWVFSTSRKPVLDIRKALKSAARKAKIKKVATPGMTRHTFATHALAAGADLQAVQSILGHKNLETTNKYTHALKESLVNAVEGLSRKKKVYE